VDKRLTGQLQKLMSRLSPTVEMAGFAEMSPEPGVEMAGFESAFELMQLATSRAMRRRDQPRWCRTSMDCCWST